MNCKVSVAMCTYNGERYLLAQLNSIFDQSRIPDELVICDDCSVDSTREILEKYRCKHPRIIRLYFNENNLGFVKNFEQAVSKCSGDIILLCDQDDIWFPHRIERSITIFTENPLCGYIFSDASLIGGDETQLLETLWVRVGFTIKRQRDYEEPEKQTTVLFPRNVVTGATMAFRAQFRKAILPIPVLSCVIHDAWIALILSLCGQYGIADYEPLIYYRIHPGQQMGARGRSILRDLDKLFADPRVLIRCQILALSAIQSRIELLDNPKAMKRYEFAFGYLRGHFESRLRSLGMKTRLRRVIPVIKLYRKGGYAHFRSPYLNALKDIVY